MSLEEESDALLAEIQRLVAVYQLSLADLVILGYSNGANIGAHIMLERANSLQQGIFLHPMSLGNHQASFSLAKQQVWLSYGQHDPIVPSETFNQLIATFKDREAQVTSFKDDMGHGLTKEELLAAKTWLEELK